MNHSTQPAGLRYEVARTLQLAAPVMIGLFAGFAMNFIDTVMAGRLPEREVAMAALATGGALWSAMLMIVLGLLMAVQPAVAQLDGAGRRGEAGAVTRQGFWIALVISIPFFAVIFFGGRLLSLFRVDASIIPVAIDYLRALAWGAPMITMMLLLRFYSEGSGHTRPTMYIGLLGALLNIPANWMLMFGHLGFPAMGARGTGFATSSVLTLQAVAMFIYVYRHSHYRPFALFERWDWPDLAEIRRLLVVGWPIAGTLFVEGSLFIAASLIIGQLGPVQTASHLVAINFSALLFMIPLGLGSAVTTRVGNALGRGEPDAARHAGMVGLGIVLCTQAISATLMIVFPGAIAAIYTGDAAIAATAAGLLFYAAVFQFPDGIQVVSAGILRGYKDTMVPMIINVIAYWVIGLSLGYWLTFGGGMGPAGMWVGMIAGLSTGAVLLSLRFMRVSSRHRRPPPVTPAPAP
ncbi:MATE family efflux transporter [Marinihelvus fidelis]|nr:MATE family efflux transporter [Marinihelvus fidelis]